MNISVVILTCSQKALTLRCLESLRDFIAGSGHEVILVDNGSTDGTAEAVAQACPDVRIIRLDHNSGVAAGRNTGLRAAAGRHLMILDNDTVVAPGTIEAMSAYLDSHPDTGVLAPRLVSPDGSVQASFKAYPGIGVKLRNILRGKSGSSAAETAPTEPCEPFYVIGAAQIFSRRTYERTGGLDEAIFYGPEDADFCMAVRALGLKVVYNPAFTIVHDYQRATTRRLLSKGARRHMAALLHFYRKHRRWW
ncbi:MAG: glycosyltransferase [Muribaculaceae bacterium]|nr:glycosyltransferase [Muribaculaceae bacterium]